MDAPAGFGRRLAAALIDTAVLATMLLALAAMGFAVLVVVAALTPEARRDAATQAMVGPEALVVLLMALIVAGLYSSALHSSAWQATIGKRMLGLRVTDLEGRPISFARAGARHLATSLVWLTVGIGFLLIALPGRQGVHDLSAGTLVLRRRPEAGGHPMPASNVGEPWSEAARRAVPTGNEGASWWWDGRQWQRRASDAVLPVRVRMPRTGGCSCSA